MFESYLATIHEEQGPVVLRKFLREIYDPILPAVVEAFRPFHTHQSALEPSINYVGLLMEWQMKKGFAGKRRLAFTQEANVGKDLPTWTVKCQYEEVTTQEFGEPKVTTGSHSTAKMAKYE